MSADFHRKAKNFRWEGVDVLPYREDARALFKGVTRQVLFCDPEQESELRYFEVAPGGFSTLERHRHTHSVLVLRGSGRCLVGREVRQLDTNDLVAVPQKASRWVFSAWSTAPATSRNCPQPRTSRRSRRIRGSRPSCAASVVVGR